VKALAGPALAVSVLLAAGPATAAPLSASDAPSAWALLPALAAIAAAIAFRQVLPALFAGVWLGAWLIAGAAPAAVWSAFLETFSTHIVGAIADSDHASIIAFTLMIGGMVGIISKNGGVAGIVRLMTRVTATARRAQLGVAALGVAIFFDDYANTLIVGNTMRPIADERRISREKLAYLVDSTAAPISAIAVVTTWVGYEIGLIGDAIRPFESLSEPFIIFLNSIPYAFYPILAIAFVFMIAASGRDFGPMLAAERRARDGQAPREDLAPESKAAPDAPPRAINAVAPVAALVIGVVGGLFATGEGDSLREVIGSADSYRALLWGSLIGAALAGLLSLGQRILSLGDVVDAWSDGVREMLAPVLILVLAWSLASVTATLGAAEYLTAVIDGAVPLALMPALVFVVAAATAFATGTSWGVMGILIPLVVPLMARLLGGEAGAIPPGDMALFYAAIASILSGAVWGDHCSPISDTTVMSSIASGCDHVDHVRTQAPYALVVGAVAIAAGLIPAAVGLSPWAGLAIGAALLAALLALLGRDPERAVAQARRAAAG